MRRKGSCLYGLGDAAHTGSPLGLADVFYGTVESNGILESLQSTCDGEVGSAFNKIVASEVEFWNSDCSDAADQMIQEVYAGSAETTVDRDHLVAHGAGRPVLLREWSIGMATA